MKFLRLAFIALVMQTSLALAQTTFPLTVQWPDGTGQTYVIHGITMQPASESGTYQIPNGRHITIDTTGCSVGFDTLLSKVHLMPDFSIRENGVTFDPSTCTFTFPALELKVDLQDFDGPLSIDSPAKKPTPGVTTWKLIPGMHNLVYGSNKVPFNFTADGFVTLMADVNGVTARHNTITVRGTPETLSGAPSTPTVDPEQAKTDQDLHDRVLAATANIPAKQDFTLRDKMKLIAFSEQQVHYPVALPAGADPASLQLLDFTDTTVRSIPFQLSDDHSTIYFRTDLPIGATRLFRLVPGNVVGNIVPKAGAAPLTFAANGDTALLGNGLISLKVPAGHHDFAGGQPFASTPAPMLGIKREGQTEVWAAAESFKAPDALTVTSMDTKMLESGTVFSRYQVTYHLSGNRTYTTTLELRAGETHVAVGETVDGFSPADEAFLRLNYGQGMTDPDRRLLTEHSPYSGNYDRNISTDDRFRPWYSSYRWLDFNPATDTSDVPRLDIRLGLFIPNAIGLFWSTTFYREDGDDALLLSIDKPEQWQESTRYSWTDYRAVENLRFYQSGTSKYMETQLAGAKRFWVLGVIPRDQVVMKPIIKTPGSPDVYLANNLGFWNLQDEIERSVDWNEDLSTPPTFDAEDENWDAPAQSMTFDEYKKEYIDATVFQWPLMFTTFTGNGMPGRNLPSAYRNYILSRQQWTPEQREQVREILIYNADAAEGDWVEPHHGMMGGHPNFIMDVKQMPAIAAAAFPNHPKAKLWRDSFLQYVTEWLHVYTRQDVPELNTQGGRWTENIACYWGQSLTALLEAEISVKAFDGTSLGKNPDLVNIIRWEQAAFMSPQDGVRMVPPEGAHSHSMLPGGRFWRNFFRLCAEIGTDNPQLAAEMKWIETNGKEGTKPDVHSALYTDYGPVFHYDFGGPHESYAHMQNIYGRSYRWGYSGIVYYGAKDRAWSYNTMETNGDEFDWNQISDFTVNGKGLDPTPTDQLLYDFDFAQFYRVLAPKADFDYRARAMMLLRDDYLVLADEVSSPDVRGTFNWVSVYDQPQFYQLKPGAPPVDGISRDPQPVRYHNPDRIAKLRSFTGQGDFLTVVAPAPVDAKAASFGATVNGEYVFASQKPQTISEGPAVFSGSYGYARDNQLALFQGTRIGLNGFTISRDGGDFGLSAIAEPARISGRIVGRSGGKISVIPPTGHDLTHVTVVYNGQTIPHTVDNGAITFSITIAQSDGLKKYAINF